jgi:hypothetical protein
VDTSNLTTPQLWDITHVTLLEHDWAEARSLLDDLGLRNDNYDCLSSAEAYGMTRLKHGEFFDVIKDRIDLVNMKVERNSWRRDNP